jgi:DNA replication protein DnaC
MYPKLLIDELGDPPPSREEASLFFRLLVCRYERRSPIVTSNESFTAWDEVFNDHVLATAILDRLPHTPRRSTSRAKAPAQRRAEDRAARRCSKPEEEPQEPA